MGGGRSQTRPSTPNFSARLHRESEMRPKRWLWASSPFVTGVARRLGKGSLRSHSTRHACSLLHTKGWHGSHFCTFSVASDTLHRAGNACHSPAQTHRPDTDLIRAEAAIFRGVTHLLVARRVGQPMRVLASFFFFRGNHSYSQSLPYTHLTTPDP